MPSFLHNQIIPGSSPFFIQDNTEAVSWIVTAVLDSNEFKNRIQSIGAGGGSNQGSGVLDALKYCMPSYNGGSSTNWDINPETKSILTQLIKAKQDLQLKLKEYADLDATLTQRLTEIYATCSGAAPCAGYCFGVSKKPGNSCPHCEPPVDLEAWLYCLNIWMDSVMKLWSDLANLDISINRLKLQIEDLIKRLVGATLACAEARAA
jgi:hypothetical protein